MRRMMLVLATVLLAAGCAREPAPAAVPVPSPVLSPSPVAEHRDADIYVQVLRRYLGTPAENSFAQNFPTVHVLDRTSGGTPVAPADQQRIADELTGVTFVADRNSVVVTEGCAHVKDGGILITLGTIDGGGSPAAGR